MHSKRHSFKNAKRFGLQQKSRLVLGCFVKPFLTQRCFLPDNRTLNAYSLSWGGSAKVKLIKIALSAIGPNILPTQTDSYIMQSHWWYWTRLHFVSHDAADGTLQLLDVLSHCSRCRPAAKHNWPDDGPAEFILACVDICTDNWKKQIGLISHRGNCSVNQILVWMLSYVSCQRLPLQSLLSKCKQYRQILSSKSEWKEK